MILCLNNYYYNNVESPRYDQVDRIEMIFTDEQPNKDFLLALVDKIQLILKSNR